MYISHVISIFFMEEKSYKEDDFLGTWKKKNRFKYFFFNSFENKFPKDLLHRSGVGVRRAP